MNELEILQILSAVHVVLSDGHFVLTSGRHGSSYVNKDALYPHTRQTELLCQEIARRFLNGDIEVVVGPAIGAIVLAHGVARNLTQFTGFETHYACAEKAENGFVIKRGYDKIVQGKRVLIVEDILTTGGSALKTVEVVRSTGGEVVAVAVLCNRGGVTTQDLGDVPKLDSLVNISMETWAEAECPLCAQGIPINVDVGKGREFLARK